VRVSALNVPIPYNHAMEQAALPEENGAVEAVGNMFGV
jgi:pyruvate dehydrogenase E1 component beta subunit